jgi:hypothetical protein
LFACEDEEKSREFQAYCEKIRKMAKSASIDLQAKKHMLEETISNWTIFHELYDSLENWLNEGEAVLGRTSEEKMVSANIGVALEESKSINRLKENAGRFRVSK